MPKTSSEPAATTESGLVRRTLNGPTMGTRWSVTLDVEPALDTATAHAALAAAVQEVDGQMSPWKPDSDLSRLNRAAPDTWVDLPAATLSVLDHALHVSRASRGAFDPAVGALVDAWGFGAARDAPDAAAIRAATASGTRPAYLSLELDLPAGRARKHTAMQLDLCGIAKGYAVDRMVAMLQGHGVTHALAALDGELRTLGPQGTGKPWAVALESPQFSRRTTHGVIELADLAVATSGDYRHWLQLGEARIAHSMDGRSNAPVRNDVACVTVLAKDCISADAWATALLVAGAGEGMALAQQMGLEALWLLRRGDALVELGLGRFASAR